MTAPRHALVTGSAGFVGRAVCRRLLDEGWRVTGIDALTDYYDPGLKRARLATLESPAFRNVEARIETPGVLGRLMEERPDAVVHLAAQAGVRHSIEAPETYVEANLTGTFRLLEAARAHPPTHLLLASTSSVYGANAEMPYTETAKADLPMSFYAATKKANEAMAHSYAHLYGLPTTMFRFFTVYGPWGRPDMALFKFVRAALSNEPIDLYNGGEMRRDFTYIDDLVEGVVRLIDVPPPLPRPAGPAIPGALPTLPDDAVPTAVAEAHAAPVPGDPNAPVPGDPNAPVPGDPNAPVPGDPNAPVPGDSLSPVAPFRIVNIGNASPVELGAFIAAIEAALGRPIERRLLPMQPGDVPATWADTSLLETLTGHRPATPVAEGVRRFVVWYRDFYGA